MGNCMSSERICITEHPQTQEDVIPGSSVQLSLKLTGEPKHISWEFKPSNTPRGWQSIASNARNRGVHSSTLTIYPERGDEGAYRALVEIHSGITIMTRIATLTLACPPEITHQPFDQQNFTPKKNVAFSVQATGKQPLKFEWQYRPINFEGAEWQPLLSRRRYEGVNTASLVIRGVQHCDESQYRCSVSNALGHVETKVATLTVAHPPEIKLQPIEHTTTVGGKEILSVRASGTEPLQYSWEWKPLYELAEGEDNEWKPLPMDSDRIQGANSGNLVVIEVSKSDEGRYRCIVSNKVGSMQSNEATLTMAEPPRITQHPEDQKDLIPENDVMLVVKATGTEPLQYDWEKKVEGGTYTMMLQAGRNSFTFGGPLGAIKAENLPSGRHSLTISGIQLEVHSHERSMSPDSQPSLGRHQVSPYQQLGGVPIPHNGRHRQSLPTASILRVNSDPYNSVATGSVGLHSQRHSFPIENSPTMFQKLLSPGIQRDLPGISQDTILSDNHMSRATSVENSSWPIEIDNWQTLPSTSRVSGIHSAELMIRRLQESDEGKYRCVVRNLADDAVSNLAVVTVLHIDMLMEKICKEGNIEELRKLLAQWKHSDMTTQKALMTVVSMDEEYTEVLQVFTENDISPTFELDGWMPLQIACTKGHSKILEHFLAKGANPNIKTMDGRGLLHLACEKGHLKVAMVLISKRVDVNLQDKLRRTPLHVTCEAARELSPGKVRQIAEILVENGARCDPQDEAWRTPLHTICSVDDAVGETVLLLLKKGAIVNSKDKESNTPLHIASHLGFVEIVEKLLNAEADPTIENENGDSSLHLACSKGHTDTVKVLLEHKNVKTMLEQKEKKYVNSPNKEGRTPLHLAYCSGGSRKIVEVLHRKGADINSQDGDSNTPLHLACSRDYGGIVKFLLQKGANVDRQNKDENTPLHLACSSGFSEIVEMLMEKGANKVLENKDGYIAADLALLHDHHNLLGIKGLTPRIQRPSSLETLAATTHAQNEPDCGDCTRNGNKTNSSRSATQAVYKGPTKEVQAKAAKGALQKYFHVLIHSITPQAVAPDLYSEGIIDDNAMEMARIQLNTVQHRAEGLLLDLIRKVEARPQWFETICAIFEKQLVPCVQDLREEYQQKAMFLGMERATTEGNHEVVAQIMRQCNSNTEVAQKGLMIAAKKGQAKIVSMLLEDFDVTPDIQDDDGRTLLHLAANEGHSNIIEIILKTERMGNVEEQDKRGQTPLHRACDAIGRIASTTMDGSEAGAKKAQLLDVISTLLRKGARIDTKDEAGNTPLHLICRKGSVEAVKMLHDESDVEQWNQAISIKNRAGETPADAARSLGNITKLLSKRRPSVGKQFLKFWQKQDPA